MDNLDMWFAYPAEDTLLARILHLLEEYDVIHHIPMRRAQETGLLFEVHRLGMVVTQVRTLGSDLPFPDLETSAAPLSHPLGRTIVQSPFQH